MEKRIDDELQSIRSQKINSPEINLLILLDQAYSVVQNAIELEIKHLHITQAQVKVLHMLSKENRPVTLDELGDFTVKEFNSVFSLIKRMEEKGLIKKVKKEDDLKTYVSLTEKGSILYHKKVTERSVYLIFGKLTDKERAQFESILTKIRDTTRELLGMDYKPPFMS